MKRKNIFSAIALLAMLGACNSVATRNAPLEDIPQSTMPIHSAGIKSSQSVAWRVEDVRISVPESLSVSEANLYLPPSDTVWREDPHGDRRAQVAAILDLAVSQAVVNLDGTEAVFLDVELRRFHALSQKARPTVGGQHTILFDVYIRDVATNVDLIDPLPIEIKLKAIGGQKAIEAEIRGETQKVRIKREITSVMKQYLGM